MLDNEAAHTAQECMDRYLLNNTLLARVFDGPEGARHCPGVTFLTSFLVCIFVISTLRSMTDDCAATCEGLHGNVGGDTEFSGHKECLKAFSRDHLTPEVEVCFVVSIVVNYHIENGTCQLTPPKTAEHRVPEGALQKAGAGHILSMTRLMTPLECRTAR